MRIHRFFALILGALALTMTSAHVLEMPQKLAYPIDFYSRVNGTLYREFAIVGGAYTVLSILVVGALAWRARRRPSAPWSWAAAAGFLATFVSWLILVAPVNSAAAQGVSWSELRPRWEVGHMVGFILTLAGFAFLCVSVLVEVPVRARQRVHVEVAGVVEAPPARLMELYLDYRHWHELFPATIRGVRWIRTEGATTTLEVDHAKAGKVPNIVTVTGKNEIHLYEAKPHYEATFVNRFEPVPEGTRYTVVADVALRGALRALAWIAAPIVRARMRRFVLAPMQAAARR